MAAGRITLGCMLLACRRWGRAGARAWAGLVAAATLCALATAETLTYVLTPQPAEGRLRVELTWQTEGRTVSELCVSQRWGTVEDVPGLLKEISFEGGVLERRESACWVVSHRRGAGLNCRYVVDTGRRELDWSSIHFPVTTRSFFHGTGNAFLLVPRARAGGSQEYEVLLRWELPRGWQAVCSWGSGPHVGAQLSVDDLRHSLYLAGVLDTHVIEVAGAGKLTVAMPRSFGFDVESLGRMAAEIIAAQCAFMEEGAFPPFVVAAVPVAGRSLAGQARLSGMGLYRSLALFLPATGGLTEAVEHMFAHENFHHWNGQMLRAAEPQGLVYWFTEGLTDYYALRILYESGRWTAQTYAEWINRHLREYYANPARNVSNQQIEAEYWRQRDTVGEVPYQRGLLLGLRWHRLARDCGVSEGVDRLFKVLVERGRQEGFRLTNEAIRQAGVELLGKWFGTEFDRYVVAGETIEVPTDALAPGLIGRAQVVHQYELGFDRERSLREQRICGLVRESAAERAGLREGDELLGWSIHGEPDQKVQLQVRRGNKLKTISYYPRGARQEVLQFRAVQSKAAGRSGG